MNVEFERVLTDANKSFRWQCEISVYEIPAANQTTFVYDPIVDAFVDLKTIFDIDTGRPDDATSIAVVVPFKLRGAVFSTMSLNNEKLYFQTTMHEKLGDCYAYFAKFVDSQVVFIGAAAKK